MNTTIFLQGSYADDTHTRGDSDIDVVITHCNYFYDISALGVDHLSAFRAHFSPATYKWADFKRDVLLTLTQHFGQSSVTPGNKAIKVQISPGRMTADVIPAFEHNTYTAYTDHNDNWAHRGIQFLDAQGAAIINYPRQHIAGGQAKNAADRTGGRYKPTVRLFKNFRTWLVENRRLADGVAPSYYIECLLYNVPDYLFPGNFEDTVPAILTHLLTAPVDKLRSQNELKPLIGTGPTQWPAENLRAFLAAAAEAWNNW